MLTTARTFGVLLRNSQTWKSVRLVEMDTWSLLLDTDQGRVLRPRRGETMKISDMPTHADVTRTLLQDPELRAEWERTALARAVAIAVVRYRADHQLSQRQLAEQLGWKQPAVARLELGESTPSFATLCELAQKLDLELVLSITPDRAMAPWFAPPSSDTAVIAGTNLANGTRIVFAARPAGRAALARVKAARNGGVRKAG